MERKTIHVLKELMTFLDVYHQLIPKKVGLFFPFVTSRTLVFSLEHYKESHKYIMCAFILLVFEYSGDTTILQWMCQYNPSWIRNSGLEPRKLI